MDIPPAPRDPDDAPIADFWDLPRRVRAAARVVAVLAVVALGVDAVGSGLSLALVLRWGTAGLALLLSVATVLAILHALGGADAAQKRGERLAGADVGWVPPRRPERSPFGRRQAERSGSPSNDEDASA